jgi:ubiquitin carboxyl-terminal hydrolase 5/13
MAKLADGLLSGRYSVVETREEGSGFVPIASADGTETSDAALHHHERPNFQLGLKPTMFKALVGKDHIEFSTMKQQDADEFLKHLLKIIRQSIRTSKNNADNQDDPTRQFSFRNETRLQCGDCRGVRYGTEEQESITIPVPAVQITRSVHDIVDNVKEGKKVEYESIALETCLESLMSTVEVDYHCPVCVKNVTAYK